MNQLAKFPDLILERYLLEELPERQMEDIRARAEVEESLRVRLQSLRASTLEILAADTPEKFVTDLIAWKSARSKGSEKSSDIHTVRKSKPSRIWPRWNVLAPAGVVLAFGLLLMVYPKKSEDTEHIGSAGLQSPTVFDVRLKGSEAGLSIFRKTRLGTELVLPHGLIRPGDILQIFYQSRLPQFGMVFSVDGRGTLTRHLPEVGGMSLPLQPGSPQPLPHAYRLDGAPRLERFFLITAPSPFSTDSILAMVKAQTVPRPPLDSLTGLGPDFRQYPYTLNKLADSAAKRQVLK